MLRKDVVQVLEGMAKDLPPPPTPEEVRKIRARHAGRISPITVCECGWKDFFHRMGCANMRTLIFRDGKPVDFDTTGHKIQWLFLVADGPLEGSGSRIIEHGVDFCFTGDNDAIQPESGRSHSGNSEVGEQ